MLFGSVWFSAALYTSSFFCDTWTPADTHSQASLSAGFLPPNPDIIAHPVPVADVFVDSNKPVMFQISHPVSVADVLRLTF